MARATITTTKSIMLPQLASELGGVPVGGPDTTVCLSTASKTIWADSVTQTTLNNAVSAHTADSTWGAPTATAITSQLFGSNTIPVTALPQTWPIGSIFVSAVSTNPAVMLGYGTWVTFGAGKVIVGLDGTDVDFTTAEQTGGTKTSVISAHTATAVANHVFTQPAAHANHVVTQAAAHTQVATKQGAAAGNVITVGTHSGGAVDAHSVHVSGAVDAHAITQPATHTAPSVVQPYVVCYFWKRTV